MIPTKKRNVIWKITWAILIINIGAIQAQLESETEATTEVSQRDVISAKEDESTTWVGVEGVALAQSDDSVVSTESAESVTDTSLEERHAILQTENSENEQTTEIFSNDFDKEAGVTEINDLNNRSGVNTESEAGESTESEFASRQETVANTETETEPTESTESELDSRQGSVAHTEFQELEGSAESDLGSRLESEKSAEPGLDNRQESEESTESELGSRQESAAGTETVPVTESELESRQESTTVIDPELDSRQESISSEDNSELESTTLTLVERKANVTEAENRQASIVNPENHHEDAEEISTTVLPEQRHEVVQDDSLTTESELESRQEVPTTESNLESRNESPATEQFPESLNDAPATESDLDSRNDTPTTESDLQQRNESPATENTPEPLNGAPAADSVEAHHEVDHVALVADEEFSTTETDPELLSKSEIEQTEPSSSTELNLSSENLNDSEYSQETEQTTEPDLLSRQEDVLATTATSEDTDINNESRSAPTTTSPASQDGAEEASTTERVSALLLLSAKDAGEDSNEESTTVVVSSQPEAVESRDGVHQPSSLEKDADLAHTTTEQEETTTFVAPTAAVGEDSFQQRNFGKLSAPVIAKNAKHQYQDYRVYRVTLPTEDSTQTILKLEAHPGVDFWADPKLLLRPRGIFVTSATDIMVAPEAISDVEQFLDDENLPYEILIENIQDAINDENPDEPIDSELAERSKHPLTWDRYHTSEDIYSYMKYLTLEYPEDASLIEIGKTPEGKPLQVLRIARKNDALRDRKALFFDAGMHAREWIAPATLTYVIRELVENPANDCLMEKFEWYFLPLANPDGYDYSHNVDRMWRKNRAPNATAQARESQSTDHLGVDPALEANNELEKDFSSNSAESSEDLELFRSARPVNRKVECTGTDLNRNFRFHWRKSGSSRNPCSESFAGSDSFSEPETQALAQFILERKDDIILYVNLHAYSQMWLLPWGYTDTRPDDYAELFSLAKVGVRALEAVHNTSYLMGAIPDLLYKASGSAQDWAKGTAGIKYSYTIELRDAGRHGFLLPANQIIPTGEETWAAFKAVAQELSRRTYPGFWGRLIC